MHEVMRDPCCAVPEALVVMDIIPLCEVGRLRGDAAMERLVERVAMGDVAPISGTYELPLRCASVVSCQDAVELTQRLGAFVC